MTRPRSPAQPRAALVGVALVAVGLLLWVAYHIVAGRERHAYTAAGAPPSAVEFHLGKTYWLAVPGGIASEKKAAIQPSTLACSAQRSDAADVSLRLTTEQSDTKAVDEIASFPSPITGRAHVSCAGLAAVYVDNSSADASGYLLVLASIALTVGIAALLSGLRQGRLRRDHSTVDSSSQHDKIEALVDGSLVIRQHGEISDADRRDIRA